MKFRTADLRTAVAAAIKAHREEWDANIKAEQEKHRAARTEWITEHGEAWKAACTDIREALRRGKPVTRDMLPCRSDRYSGAATFDNTEPAARTYPGPGRPLERVQTALRLITDAEVSTTALTQLGVSSSVLRDVLDLMPAAKASKS